MSISTISDVLTRISQIESQIGQLDGSAPSSSGLATTLPSASTGSSSSSSAVGAGSFSNALAQAQGTGTSTGAAGFGSLGSSLLGSPSNTQSSLSALSALLPAGSTGAVRLPSSASTLLTSGQQQFASTLAADTGLDPGVITSWLLAEESGSAAQSRQAANNNDWLNVGYTNSGTYGASDPIWSDPVAAANATAAWMQGQSSVQGYGTASPGVQAILQSAGQPAAQQIAALQQSGWSSGGYPNLGSLYSQVTGGAAATIVS